MVSPVNAQYAEVFARSTVDRVVLVRLHLDPAFVLVVLDWTVAADVAVEMDPSFAVLLQEGVDFNAEISNEATAINIANAFNAVEQAAIIGQKSGIKATPLGDRVWFVGGALSGAITVTATDPAFALDVLGPVPTSMSFVSGDTPLFGYPCSIATISPAAMKADEFTRETTVGALDIEWNDHAQTFREPEFLLFRKYLMHAEVLLGAQDMDEANFEPIGTYVINDPIPEKGSLSVSVYDFAEEGWKNQTLRGAVVDVHPLEAVLDYMDRVDALDAIDETTLDPSLYEDISHFVVSRYDDTEFGLRNTIDDPEKVTDVIRQLIFLCGGLLTPGLDGRYRYIHFDIDKAVDRIWRAGPPGSASEGYDIDRVEQLEGVGRLTNKCVLTFAKRQTGDTTFAEESEETHEQTEENSRLRFGKLIELLLDLLYCNGLVTPANGFISVEGGAQNGVNAHRIFHDSTDFSVPFAARQGFCGMRWERVGSTWVLRPGASLGGVTGRYCILLLRSYGAGNARIEDNNPSVGAEYIAIDEWTLDNQGVDSPVFSFVPAPNAARAHIADTSVPELDALGFGLDADALYGRGGLNTLIPGAGDPPGSQDYWEMGVASQGEWPFIIDATIPVAIARRILRRHRFGAPKIKVRTSLAELGLELGDFVAIDGDDLYLGHERSGLDTSVVWEIVGKNVDALSDSPGIEWELAFVRDEALDAAFPPIFEPAPVDPPIVIVGDPDFVVFDDPAVLGATDDVVDSLDADYTFDD